MKSIAEKKNFRKKSLRKRSLRLAVLAAVLLMLLTLSACGGSPSLVVIRDDGMNTEIELNLPRRVDKILMDAEIPLGKNDEVIPSLNSNLNPGETITVVREHTVKLTADGETKEVKIVGGTVSDLLEKEGITLKENQMTSEPLDKVLADNMEVEILDKLKIAVVADGKRKEAAVEAETVGEALEEIGISLDEDDRVDPGTDEALSNEMEITIRRVEIEEIKEREEMPFETISEPTEAFLKGVEVVSREGAKGEKEVTYRVTLVDGEEESREAVEESVIKKPVSRILIVGNYEEPVYEDFYYDPNYDPYYDPNASYDPDSDAGYSESSEESTGEGGEGASGEWPSGEGASDEGVPGEPASEPGESETGGQSETSQEETPTDPGSNTPPEQVYEVSREDIPNCSGDGHGYYHITYSDGTEVDVEY